MWDFEANIHLLYLKRMVMCNCATRYVSGSINFLTFQTSYHMFLTRCTQREAKVVLKAYLCELIHIVLLECFSWNFKLQKILGNGFLFVVWIYQLLLMLRKIANWPFLTTYLPLPNILPKNRYHLNEPIAAAETAFLGVWRNYNIVTFIRRSKTNDE